MDLTLIPSDKEMSSIKDIAAMAVKSGFLPNSIKTPEQAIIIALKGRELGIPAMQAFAQIAVVQGKPTISAELMLSLIYRNVPKSDIVFKQSDNNGCVIEARRRHDQAFSIFSFTAEDAKRAGLLGKDSWSKYPAAMYRARAISAMARAIFADAIAGCSYTPEELGAEVNDDGEVTAAPTAPPKLGTSTVETTATTISETPVEKGFDDELKRTWNRLTGNHQMTQSDAKEFMIRVTGVQSSKEMTLENLAAVNEAIDRLGAK